MVFSNLRILRPVRIYDNITVIAEVIQKNDKTNSIELKTDILNQNKQIIQMLNFQLVLAIIIETIEKNN